MPKQIKIKIRKETINFQPDWSKADIARFLFAEDDGFSVSEVAKAIPMAYSQAHQIFAKMPQANQARTKAVAPAKPKPEPKPAPITQRPASRKRRDEAKSWTQTRVSELLQEAKGGTRPLKKTDLRNSKELGPCLNCGFPLAAQSLGGQRQIIHYGSSPEEYRDTVQFCHAFPKSLG